MFLGHFGVAFGTKTRQASVSLGTLFLATQFADLLWPTLLLFGVEEVTIQPEQVVPFKFVSYPITHSLLLDLLWGLGLGLGYWLLRRNVRGAVLVGLLVPSHWLLDLVVHVPDLPLYPGASPLFGWGLWNYPVATQLVEAVLFGGGLWLYVRRTQARNRAGRYGLWVLVGLLVLVHVSSLLGPPPASVTALAWMGQTLWLVVILAYWVDRNRTFRTGPAGAAGTPPAFHPSIV